MNASIWRYPRFVLYALGGFINSTGSSIYGIALPLLVLHLTGSVAAMGIMGVCETIPRSLLGLFVIGPLVDRVSRRVVLITSLVFQAICSMLIALLNTSGILQIWMLYLLGALIMIAHEFVRAADFAVIPAMFGDRKMEAMAGLQSTFRLALILGPIIASVMLAYMDYNSLLWVNAITYLGPVMMCIWTRVPHENLGGVRSFGQVMSDMRDGMTYIVRNRVLVNIISVVALSNLAVGGNGSLMLFHLKHDFGMSDQRISWILALVAVGSLLSSMLSPRLKLVAKGKLMFWGLAISSTSVALYLLPVFWIVPVALIGAGLGWVLFIVAYGTLVQEMASNEMLGRVGSSVRMIEFFSIGISTSVMTSFAEHYGAHRAFISAFVLSLVPLLVLSRGAANRENGDVQLAKRQPSV